ncbi:MAG: MFS transporter [Prevotella sp.]|nr:MFS transporter [Prevotella sp.]
MNTQNTPVHIKLWHRDFWLLVVANLLLTMSVYILLPVLPQWLMQTENLTPEETGLTMGAFGLGLYLLGSQCSWLVQRYRRNVVCMWAVIVLALDVALLGYMDGLRSVFVEFWVILLHRLVLGATFGLAQMVLSSTLIIDTCESYQRTEANYSASWFARFALSLGPLAGLMTYRLAGFGEVLWGAIGCALLSVVFIKLVNFPFRSPEENVHVASLDRFLLPEGHVLFANLLLVSTVMGLLLTLPLTMLFYGLMMGGFLLALLAQRFVFRDAELKSEVVSGLILLIAALLILLGYPASPVAPVLVGLGMGITSARFLLFFIKLSRHCKRGTSQSTFFLGWETGIALGLALGYGLMYGRYDVLLYTSLALVAVALLMYHLFTHAWFVRNKNR